MEFLCSSPDDYSCILEKEGISLLDKISFACQYLPDDQLKQFVFQQKDKLTAKGDLQAIFLTGLSKESIPVLQNYVDRTADIQTVYKFIEFTHIQRLLY